MHIDTAIIKKSRKTDAAQVLQCRLLGINISKPAVGQLMQLKNSSFFDLMETVTIPLGNGILSGTRLVWNWWYLYFAFRWPYEHNLQYKFNQVIKRIEVIKKADMWAEEGVVEYEKPFFSSSTYGRAILPQSTSAQKLARAFLSARQGNGSDYLSVQVLAQSYGLDGIGTALDNLAYEILGDDEYKNAIRNISFFRQALGEMYLKNIISVVGIPDNVEDIIQRAKWGVPPNCPLIKINPQKGKTSQAKRTLDDMLKERDLLADPSKSDFLLYKLRDWCTDDHRYTDATAPSYHCPLIFPNEMDRFGLQSDTAVAFDLSDACQIDNKTGVPKSVIADVCEKCDYKPFDIPDGPPWRADFYRYLVLRKPGWGLCRERSPYDLATLEAVYASRVDKELGLNDKNQIHVEHMFDKEVHRKYLVGNVVHHRDLIFLMTSKNHGDHFNQFIGADLPGIKGKFETCVKHKWWTEKYAKEEATKQIARFSILEDTYNKRADGRATKKLLDLFSMNISSIKSQKKRMLAEDTRP